MANPLPLTRSDIRRRFIEQFGTARKMPGAAIDALALWVTEKAEALTDADMTVLFSVGRR